MKRFKKVLKITFYFIVALFIALVILFYRFSEPKSDESIVNTFQKEDVEVFLSYDTYKDFEYRVLRFQKDIDTLKPTFVFVHGATGSCMDFKSYVLDEELRSGANLITYDRVGYGPNNAGDVQESIAFERDLLESLVQDIPKDKLVLVGYSYGGPIALALNEKIQKLILLAPAVYSEVEPMPWMLNFYTWKLTRWMVPKTWVSASREKLTHKQDLRNFEKNWNDNPNEIISIHGLTDGIVPFSNSQYLKGQLDANRFKLIPLDDAGHGLVWIEFEAIKNVFLQEIN